MLQLYAYIKEKYTKVLSMQSKWNQRLEFYPDTGYFQFFLSKFNKLLNLKFSSYLYLLNINLEMKDLNFEMGSNWNGVGTSKNGFGFYHRVLLLLLALISNGDVSLTIRLFEQTIEKWYRNGIPPSQQCYFRFFRALRLRFSAAHLPPNLF